MWVCNFTIAAPDSFPQPTSALFGCRCKCGYGRGPRPRLHMPQLRRQPSHLRHFAQALVSLQGCFEYREPVQTNCSRRSSRSSKHVCARCDRRNDTPVSNQDPAFHLGLRPEDKAPRQKLDGQNRTNTVASIARQTTRHGSSSTRHRITRPRLSHSLGALST